MADIRVSEGLLRTIAADQPQCFQCGIYLTEEETFYASEKEDISEFCSGECRTACRAGQQLPHGPTLPAE